MNTLSNIKNMYKVYELLPTQDNSKQLILEPLGCVLKLSLLQYKPQGTKISVSKNSLEFNEDGNVIMPTESGEAKYQKPIEINPKKTCYSWVEQSVARIGS